MSQLSFTPHDLHIDEAGLCFNSKAPSPINTKKHTYKNTCRHTYTMSSASKPRQKQSGKSATSAHLNVKEHTWRANRALTKGIVLSTSCLTVCVCLHQEYLSQSEWVQCWFLPSLSPLTEAPSRHCWPVFIYWQDSCMATCYHVV